MEDNQIKIKAIQSDKFDNGKALMDVVVEYPEDFNRENVSFNNVGLISAYRVYGIDEKDGIPRTAIEFYGAFERVVK